MPHFWAAAASLVFVLIATAICVLIPGTAVAAAAAGAHARMSSVTIPLDKADARFGKFYVPRLASLLYTPAQTGPAPTIIWLHGCGGIGGLTLASAQADARQFAQWGYATLILDVTDARRLGDKPCSDRNTSFSLLRARRADVDAAALWLVANKIAPADKIATIGTSHGGEVAIEHDQAGGGNVMLAGAVAYYPGCDRGFPFARYPLLLLAGEKDMTDGPRQSVAATCQDYARQANSHKGTAEVRAVSYPNGPHSFDVPGVKLQVSQSLNKSIAGYDKASADASMKEIEAFLRKIFG
ncbi:MAG: dienelactone hydrolase family protein [Devosia sp.]